MATVPEEVLVVVAPGASATPFAPSSEKLNAAVAARPKNWSSVGREGRRAGEEARRQVIRPHADDAHLPATGETRHLHTTAPAWSCISFEATVFQPAPAACCPRALPLERRREHLQIHRRKSGRHPNRHGSAPSPRESTAPPRRQAPAEPWRGNGRQAKREKGQQEGKAGHKGGEDATVNEEPYLSINILSPRYCGDGIWTGWSGAVELSLR